MNVEGLRVCIASQSFYPFAGGVSYYLYYFTQELLRRGVEVLQVHLGKSSLPSFEVVEGVKVYRVDLGEEENWRRYASFKEKLYEQIHGLRREGEWSWDGYDAFELFDRTMASKIMELYEDEGFSIVNLHDWQVFLVPEFLNVPVPVVYTWHVPFTEKMGEDLGRKAAKRLNMCNMVVFSTQRYVKHAASLGVPEWKLRCIHPFVDPERFSIPDSEGDAFREKWGIPPDGEVVLCVARIDPVKSHEDLLKAFLLVKEERENAKLVCVGDGSLSENVLGIRDERKERIFRLIDDLGLGEDVVFTGYLPHEDLPKAYKMADVVVLPSKMEGFGLSLTEAMASSKPVVAYDVGGVGVQVKDGVNGFLVDPGDIEGFAGRITQLLSDSELRGRMGAAAKRTVEEMFDVRKAVDRYIEVFGEVLEREK
ncbi:MAG: glycosyltransferase family 4 protein [Candidatus Freyarchaeota archaeon]|nr:glycosyltransferase family 4 protein [Candidatus Freyrarchaeum guaymaensis]